MPTPNVELVRKAFERFRARDADGIIELMHPDGELYPYAIDERRGTGYHGHDGLRQYLADVDGMFERFDVDISHLEEVDEATVFAKGRMRGRTHDGADLDVPGTWLWTARDGRLVRMVAYIDTRGERQQQT